MDSMGDYGSKRNERHAAILIGCGTGALLSLISAISFGEPRALPLIVSIASGAAEGFVISATGMLITGHFSALAMRRIPRIVIVALSSALVHLAIAALVRLLIAANIFFMTGIVSLLSVLVGEWLTARDRAAHAERLAADTRREGDKGETGAADSSREPRLEGIPLNERALSPREREVARLLLARASYQEISRALFISIPTVKSHCSSIYSKLGVKGKAGLVALCSRQKADQTGS